MDQPTADAVAGQMAHLDDLVGSAVMTALAWASLRHRATAFTATFLSVFLGAALIGAFATLAQTATGHEVSAADAETLHDHGPGGRRLGQPDRAVLRRLHARRSPSGSAPRRSACSGSSARRRARPGGWCSPRPRSSPASAAVLGAPGRVAGRLPAARPAAQRRHGRRRRGVRRRPRSPSAAPPSLVVLTSLLAAAITARRTTNGPATLAIAEARGGLRADALVADRDRRCCWSPTASAWRS